MYKLYADSNRRGWELIVLALSEEYLEYCISHIDQEVYRGYMVIEDDGEKQFPIKRERFDEVKVKKRKI